MSTRRSIFMRVTMTALIVSIVISLFTRSALKPVLAAPNYQEQLYQSCTDQRGITPTPTPESAEPTVAATAAGTAVATSAATAVAVTPADNGDLTFYKIVGKESEACYQVGEIFIDEDNRFNLAVGVTKSIDGQIAIDKNNVVNSVIGDIVINVSEFQSDSPRRDGIIRQRWLESNKYPLAKLTESKTIGLPPRAYKSGEVLSFQVVGMLEVHGTKRETTFTVQAWLKVDALVVTAYTDVKMTDFGFDPPSIADLIKANDDARLVLNLVAREDKSV